MFSTDECGVTPALGQTRIMGGSAARLGQFPWVAYLSVRGPDIDKMCAGTLIADRSEAARPNYNYRVFQAFGAFRNCEVPIGFYRSLLEAQKSYNELTTGIFLSPKGSCSFTSI